MLLWRKGLALWKACQSSVVSLSNFCCFSEVVTALLSCSRIKCHRNWEHLKSMLIDCLKKQSLVCELGPLLLSHPLPSICPRSAISLSIQSCWVFFILNSVRIFFGGGICRRIYNMVDCILEQAPNPRNGLYAVSLLLAVSWFYDSMICRKCNKRGVSNELGWRCKAYFPFLIWCIENIGQ